MNRYALLAALVACKGSSGGGSADDDVLLAKLPGNNVALFGGDVAKVQKYAMSLLSAAVATAGGGDAWDDCFTGARAVGAIAYHDEKVTVTTAYRGLTLDGLEACATKAGLRADRKKHSIDVHVKTGIGTSTRWFRALSEGAVYTSITSSEGLMMMFHATSKAEDPTGGSGTLRSHASDEPGLVALAAAVDHRHALWFAASAEGTPLAAHVRDATGWIDIDGGLSAEVTVTPVATDDADHIAAAFTDMKQAAASETPAVRAVFAGITVARDHDHLKFSAKIADADLRAAAGDIAALSIAVLGGVGRSATSPASAPSLPAPPSPP